MKIVLYANTDWYLYNFRRSLIERLVARGDEVVAVSPPGEHGARLEEFGARWRPLIMDRRSLNPVSELVLLGRLVRLLREEKPGLVHGFTIKGAVYGGIAARLAGTPRRVLAVAGLGYVFSNSSFKARVLRPVVKLCMQVAFAGRDARLILQNSEDAAFFRTSGLLLQEHIRLIPGSGVDSQRFAPSARRQLRPFRALLPARLLRDKGVESFVDAARILRSKGRVIEFLLAGTPDVGNPDSVTQQEVEGWVAEGAVRWVGHIEDMPALLGTVDTVVLPTRYGEGVPRSLVEAGACGLPVVATDIAGCRQLVTHEVNGLLIPIDDVDALAEAIDRLYQDPALVAGLGLAARHRVLERFSDEIVVASTLSVYDELSPARLEAPRRHA